MTPVRAPRWALSFADLCLLLLGFFVILQAQRSSPERVTTGLRAAFGEKGATPPIRADYHAAALFQRGEAVLLPVHEARLRALGRQVAARGGAIRIDSTGADGDGPRFEAWELGAARVAAVARAVGAGGVPERDVAIVMPSTPAGGSRKTQHIAITITP